MCVCCTHLFSFFTLTFVLVNDLSLVSCCSCFGNAYDFVFVFVAVCFFLLYALVFYVYCRVIPDVLSLMFFTGVSEINHLTCIRIKMGKMVPAGSRVCCLAYGSKRARWYPQEEADADKIICLNVC